MKKILENHMLSLEIQLEQMRLSLSGMRTMLELMEPMPQEKEKPTLSKNEGPCTHPKESRQELKAMGSDDGWICSLCNYVGKGVE
jgi:hypothetical protein